MLEWYLHSTTHLPDDPLTIARQCNFGQDQLAKVNDLVEEDHNKADQEQADQPSTTTLSQPSTNTR